MHPDDKVSVKWASEDWPLKCQSCEGLTAEPVAEIRGKDFCVLVCRSCLLPEETR